MNNQLKYRTMTQKTVNKGTREIKAMMAEDADRSPRSLNTTRLLAAPPSTSNTAYESPLRDGLINDVGRLGEAIGATDFRLPLLRLDAVMRFIQKPPYARAETRRRKECRWHHLRHAQPFQPARNSRLIICNRNCDHWKPLSQGLERGVESCVRDRQRSALQQFDLRREGYDERRACEFRSVFTMAASKREDELRIKFGAGRCDSLEN